MFARFFWANSRTGIRAVGFTLIRGGGSARTIFLGVLICIIKELLVLAILARAIEHFFPFLKGSYFPVQDSRQILLIPPWFFYPPKEL